MKLSDYDTSLTYSATVVSSERITEEDTDEIRHIVLNIDEDRFEYREGQSIGVLIPEPHSNGTKNYFRLYSIANSRSEIAENPNQFAICVRRCFAIDKETGESRPGIASNFLCNRSPGDTVQLTGPYGRHFTLPRDNTCNILMVGGGTGIAPFRAFIKQVYDDWKVWHGKVRLYYGARSDLGKLYLNSRKNDIGLYYDQETFRAFEAVNLRPDYDTPEPVDRALMEQAEEVWQLMLDPNTYFYISGLLGLEETVDKVFAELAGSEDDWEFMKEDMVEDGRWSTLLYD